MSGNRSTNPDRGRRSAVLTGLLAVLALLLCFSATAPAAGASTVSGTVSAGGSPVSGAVVEALDVSTSAVLASDTTGAGGSFSMTVSASSVDVRVTPPSGSGLQISTIHAVDTTSNANLEIILVPTASQVQLSGTLRDEHGNPVANGIVQLSSGPYVYTDAAGHYSFTMMPPGTYALYVYGDNLPGLPAHWSFYKPGVDMSADRVLDLTLPSTVSLSFKVQDPDGNPISGAQVVGVSASGNAMSLGPGVTGVQGTTYMNGESVTTDANGIAHYTVFGPVDSVSGAAVPNQPGFSNAGFNVYPFDQNTTTVITVPRTVQLSGTLRDEHGNPVENAIVQLAGGAYVYTDASGHYSFTTTPGTFALYVYGDDLPGLPAHWSIYQPGIDVSSDRVLDLTLPATVSLTFRLQDPDGNPVAGAQLVGVSATSNAMSLGAGLPDAQGSAYMNGDSATTDSNGIAHYLVFGPVNYLSGTAVPNLPGLNNASFNIYPYVPGTTVALVFPATDHLAPQAHLNSPAEGATYTQGQSVPADYTCEDETGGSGISRCEGTTANGQPIDTSSLGPHSFDVLAVDRAGNSSTVTHHYMVVPGGVADLTIEKTATPANPRPGDTVTYTLTALNQGNNVARDVSITDALPTGVSFVSATAPCLENASTVTCEIGSLAASEQRSYEIRVTVDQWGNANPEATHLLDVQKAEAQIDLNAGEQRTVSVSCPGGYFVVDGSVRIDHVDQGSGDWDSPEVLESRAVSTDTWRGTVRNTASGRAQAKVFAVCIRQQTNDAGGHSHNLIVSAPVTVTSPAAAGPHEAVLQCGPGQIAVAPGFESSAPGDLVYSQPEGNGWKFRLTLSAPASVTFQIRCLTRQVSTSGGHTHDLALERISHEFTVGPGQVNEAQLTCADGSKGIVAGWRLDQDLLSLGNDPRPVTRAFRLYNPTDHDLTATLSLLCLGDLTGGEHLAARTITNTAGISTSSNEIVTGNNTGSATITVEDTDNYTPVTEPDTGKQTPNNPTGGPIANRPAPTPIARITARPRRRTFSRNATFRFNSTVVGSTFECRIDNQPYAPCSSPKVYSNLARRGHTFRVRATAAGVTGPATVYQWRIRQ